MCTNGGTCEVSCWFCVPVFEANRRAMVKLWENVGRGKVGKKSLDCFKVMKGQKGGGGESGCVEYISLRDNRSRVSSRSCFEGSTYRSKLWLRDKFELCFVVEKKKGNIVVR